MILLGRDHITSYSQQHPSARTALGMWLVAAEAVSWSSQSEIINFYPLIKFTTPKIAHIYLSGVNCVITAQLAFNSGIIIILGVNEFDSSQIQGP